MVIFEKSRIPTTHDFSLYNETFEIVNCFKYLGIYFYTNGNWLRSQRRIAENASKSLHRLISVFHKFEFSINKTNVSYLTHILVSSVIHYASEIWSYHSGTDVDTQHIL